MKFVALLALAAGTFLPAQVPDLSPQTPLIGALLHNDPAEAKRLLLSGADPNEGVFVGFPPLFLATVRQDVELVRLMASKGADLNRIGPAGTTALMWAAFNETGDATLVQELLKRGADPLVTNKAGETALTWALRRGETPAVAALRKAGDSSTSATAMRNSVERALSLLQKSGSQFVRVSGCASCHHQSVPQMAIGAARVHGIPVDEATAKQQVQAVVAVMDGVAKEALQNRDRIPDPPIGVSYALLGLAAENYPPSQTTEAMAKVIGAWQTPDGSFATLPGIRPPMETSDITGTALSLRAIQLYGKGQEQQIVRAAKWLRTTAKPVTTEDQAMQLLGLAWAKTPARELKPYIKNLLAAQRQDGGWGQLHTLETDAYATGEALVALQTAGLSADSPECQRAVGYLLRTQFADGSWLVRTRTYAIQRPKESGFPHGQHQWISAAGTGWAAMALAMALPQQPATSTTSSAAQASAGSGSRFPVLPQDRKLASTVELESQRTGKSSRTRDSAPRP
jgi:hypothetical protein